MYDKKKGVFTLINLLIGIHICNFFRGGGAATQLLFHVILFHNSTWFLYINTIYGAGFTKKKSYNLLLVMNKSSIDRQKDFRCEQEHKENYTQYRIFKAIEERHVLLNHFKILLLGGNEEFNLKT